MNIQDQRPPLFAKSACGIWRDPHIQQEMLRAHLDADSDAASRTPEAIRITCDWIDRQLPPGRRILDLGCGPGLYAAQLAERGHQVTGVDLNGESIRYARKRYPGITFIEGDYIADFPAGVFDAIILIYCDIGTHSARECEELLQNCRKALSPGGKLFFDFFSEQLATERQEMKNWEHCAEGGFWAAEPYLLLSQTFHYPEHAVWASQYNLICGNDVRHFIVWERYFQREEIAAMLKASGFHGIAFTDRLLPANTFTSSHAVFVAAARDTP